jgi:transposase
MEEPDLPLLLGFKGYNILAHKTIEPDTIIVVEPQKRLTTCPHCNTTNSLYQHDKRKQQFADLPIQGNRVQIRVMRQRYRCKQCRRIAFQDLPDSPPLDEKRLATKRLVTYIERQSLKHTFTHVAEDVGLDDTTIRCINKDYIDRLEREHQWVTPEWLGMDEIYVSRVFRCVMTNLKMRTLVDILKSYNKDQIQQRLSLIQDPERIKVVCIDMHGPYRMAAKKMLPHARIVIDRFHVLQRVAKAFHYIRRRMVKYLQSKDPKMADTLQNIDRELFLRRAYDLNVFEQLRLSTWLENDPNPKDDPDLRREAELKSALSEAYRLKEALHNIYTVKYKVTASHNLREWKKQAKKGPTAMQGAADTIEEWEEEILAYFDEPPPRPTNGYTEAANGLIKRLNTIGRGYSFKILRAKALYGGQLAEKPAKYRRNWNLPAHLGGMIPLTPEEVEPPMIYGVSISHLIDRIDRGEF